MMITTYSALKPVHPNLDGHKSTAYLCQSAMADTTERNEPLTPFGRLLVQPLLDQVINCAMASDQPIPPVDAIKSEVQNSLFLIHPKFRCLLTHDSHGRVHWRPTEVDIDRHLIFVRHRLSDDPSVSNDDAVNGYLADLSFSSPLPLDKPLWEIHILEAHRAAVFRVHHALGDGHYLLTMLLSFCRRIDDPSRQPVIPVVKSGSFLPSRWSLWTVVKLIWFTFVSVLELVLRLLWLRDKTTAVSGGCGVELWPRKLATARFRLDDMKTVKRSVPYSTVNDVLFGIISIGLSRYLDIRSPNAMKVGDRITGAAMVNLRQQDLSNMLDDKSSPPPGNKFGVILLPVYYHRRGFDPLQAVKRAKAMIDRKKHSLEAVFSYIVSHFVTCCFGAKLTSILNYRVFCNTTFTISNVVGPQDKITLVGNVVNYIHATSSTLPHAITMHMISYAGVAELQILVAKDVIPEPKVLAKCFEDALVELKEASEWVAVEEILKLN